MSLQSYEAEETNITNCLFSAYAIEDQRVSDIDIESTNFEEFCTTLLKETRENDTKKLFLIQRDTTEIVSLITDLCKAYVTNTSDIEKKFAKLSELSATRLNEAQIRRKDSSPSARPPSDGGFLIIFNPIGDRIEILLAKLDIETYLERIKFQFEKGFAVENRTQKSCFMNVLVTDSSINESSILIATDSNSDKFLTFETVYVSDTNTSLAKFWHEDFLELKEYRTNLINTDIAFNAIKQLLKRKLKNSPADFSSLLNNCIGYFETNDDYKHDQMIQYVLNSYTAKDSETNLQNLKDALEELPSKKEFDSQFKMDKSKLPKATNRNIEINDNIYLTTKNHIENFDTKIVAFNDTETDTKSLLIRDISEKAYETFKQKEE